MHLHAQQQRAEKTGARTLAVGEDLARTTQEALRDAQSRVERVVPVHIELGSCGLSSRHVLVDASGVACDFGPRHLFGPLDIHIRGPERIALVEKLLAVYKSRAEELAQAMELIRSTLVSTAEELEGKTGVHTKQSGGGGGAGLLDKAAIPVTGLDQLAELAKENPQGRLIQPDEVAETVAWLCSPRSGSISGQAITISGGAI